MTSSPYSFSSRELVACGESTRRYSVTHALAEFCECRPKRTNVWFAFSVARMHEEKLLQKATPNAFASKQRKQRFDLRLKNQPFVTFVSFCLNLKNCYEKGLDISWRF